LHLVTTKVKVGEIGFADYPQTNSFAKDGMLQWVPPPKEKKKC
jgi:hypothetical protein